MSGGHFNYQQYTLEDLAEQIDDIVKTNNSTDIDEYGDKKGQHLPNDIIEKFKETVYDLRRTAVMVQRIDWLLSGDDGEDSFRERWDKEVPPFKGFQKK